jgi:hypothetical protein
MRAEQHGREKDDGQCEGSGEAGQVTLKDMKALLEACTCDVCGYVEQTFSWPVCDCQVPRQGATASYNNISSGVGEGGSISKSVACGERVFLPRAPAAGVLPAAPRAAAKRRAQEEKHMTTKVRSGMRHLPGWLGRRTRRSAVGCDHRFHDASLSLRGTRGRPHPRGAPHMHGKRVTASAACTCRTRPRKRR